MLQLQTNSYRKHDKFHQLEIFSYLYLLVESFLISALYPCPEGQEDARWIEISQRATNTLSETGAVPHHTLT